MSFYFTNREEINIALFLSSLFATFRKINLECSVKTFWNDFLETLCPIKLYNPYIKWKLKLHAIVDEVTFEIHFEKIVEI